LSQCWILSITEEGLNQRSAPSLSSRLIQLHCFSASYAASPATQLFLLHWRVGSLPLLWHTYSHSPRDYRQVPHNWLIFIDYLLVIYLR
jgi:hypothetical protein